MRKVLLLVDGSDCLYHTALYLIDFTLQDTTSEKRSLCLACAGFFEGSFA